MSSSPVSYFFFSFTTIDARHRPEKRIKISRTRTSAGRDLHSSKIFHEYINVSAARRQRGGGFVKIVSGNVNEARNSAANFKYNTRDVNRRRAMNL